MIGILDLSILLSSISNYVKQIAYIDFFSFFIYMWRGGGETKATWIGLGLLVDTVIQMMIIVAFV